MNISHCLAHVPNEDRVKKRGPKSSLKNAELFLQEENNMTKFIEHPEEMICLTDNLVFLFNTTVLSWRETFIQLSYQAFQTDLVEVTLHGFNHTLLTDGKIDEHGSHENKSSQHGEKTKFCEESCGHYQENIQYVFYGAFSTCDICPLLRKIH